jgi:two-component system, chemotaxis family, protein-glutamate methylesterase/glutaminase
MNLKQSIPNPIKAVVIGASAGAFEALGKILPQLPRDFTPAVIIVIHLPPDQPNQLPELFQPRCVLPIKEAEDKEPVSSRKIYFAPSGYHLMIERDQSFSLDLDEPVNFSRPSIDVLFESAADAYEQNLMGVILTGANEDGAAGLRKIREKGGQCLVQEPSTSEGQMMPCAAIKAADPQWIKTIDQIGPFLAGLN